MDGMVAGVEVLVAEDATGARLRIGEEVLHLGPAALEELTWRLVAARGAVLPKRLAVEFCGDRIVEAQAFAFRTDAAGREMACVMTPAGWIGAPLGSECTVMRASKASRRSVAQSPRS